MTKGLSTFCWESFKAIAWKRSLEYIARLLGETFFFISTEQISNALALQRLKLFSQLDIQSTNVAENCCEFDIRESEEDLDLIVKAFDEASNLPKHERSILYDIFGYVAFKENMTVPSDVSIPSCRSDSEFTSMVSRRKLTYPSELLFDLSLYFYALFKLREDKSCNVVFLQAFEQIHGLSEFHIDGNLKSICRRYINCFFKAFAKQNNNTSVADKKKSGAEKSPAIHNSFYH